MSERTAERGAGRKASVRSITSIKVSSLGYKQSANSGRRDSDRPGSGRRYDVPPDGYNTPLRPCSSPPRTSSLKHDNTA